MCLYVSPYNLLTTEPPPACSPGLCGQNAECHIRGSAIECRCRQGYEGDAHVLCEAQPDNPCEPSPCGPNAQCTVSDKNYAVCTCHLHFTGDADSARGCEPECVSHDDCSSHTACINSFCIDPCPGACGIDSLCKVVEHRPVCACPAGFVGNPYTRCDPLSEPIGPGKITPQPPATPCVPSPCGLNTECRVTGNRPVCSCFSGYVGDPNKACQPECVTNIDCKRTEACIDQKCRDPCVDVCGTNALCEVDNHNPICYCPKGMTGDPFRFCMAIREFVIVNFLWLILIYFPLQVIVMLIFYG